MPTIIEQRQFQADVPVVVRVPFTADGKRYVAGEPFPWRTMGVDRERVDTLFKSGFLRHDDKALPPDAYGGMSLPVLRQIAIGRGLKVKRSKADQIAVLTKAVADGVDLR